MTINGLEWLQPTQFIGSKDAWTMYEGMIILAFDFLTGVEISLYRTTRQMQTTFCCTTLCSLFLPR